LPVSFPVQIIYRIVSYNFAIGLQLKPAMTVVIL